MVEYRTRTTESRVGQAQASPPPRSGPLKGIRVVELAGIGPGPFCAMVLADMGADVLRVDRTNSPALIGPNSDPRKEVLHRGRRSVAIDLKHPDGASAVLGLVARSDVLIEGFRPGVAERLGVGPDACHSVNPALVYGRMTGYGQAGPLAQEVGHDLNYIGLSGVLSLIGRPEAPPTPPLSLLGDFGGGGMMLVAGVLAALVERHSSGRGQVIDAAMAEGAAYLAAAFHGYVSSGNWRGERGSNLVDSGSPFYDVYRTADDKWLAVAALEPAFFAQLLEVLDLDAENFPNQHDESRWPAMRDVFNTIIRGHTRADWLQRARGRACVSAVLDIHESWAHPHNQARGTFIECGGVVQPAPHPRFGRTPSASPTVPPLPGEHTRTAFESWGVDTDQIDTWFESGAITSHQGLVIDGNQ